jgi:hypothetical protein
MRGILAFGVLITIAAVPAFAANFSGKWALQNAAGRGGRGGSTVLTLNQAGDQVTGTITLRIDAGTNSPVNNEIWGGKVAGDTLSFYVWTGTDQPAKTSYRGTMSASGDEIVFTVTGGRGGGFGGGQQTAGGRPGRGGGRADGGQTATPAQGPGAAAGAAQQFTAQRVK